MSLLAIVLSLTLLATACGGCTAVVLPAVGTCATMGIEYTAKNCPTQTFTCGVDCVHSGVLEALQTMSMHVNLDEGTPTGYRVQAEAQGLKVKVELVRLTDTTTKMGVDASRNIILRDGSTAREIVAQVQQALERRGALQARAARPAATGRGASSPGS